MIIVQKTYEELLAPPKSVWECFYWNAVSSTLRLFGSLSEGMRIGYKYGFDSGEMLDYIYRNEAKGDFLLGKIVDRCHLNAIGWKAIRQRKINVKNLLREAVIKSSQSEKSVHVVDVAAGPGRYLLETLKELPSLNIKATLRDRDEVGLLHGRQNAEAINITNAYYEKGDAFDPNDLVKVKPRPDVVIVSGLYELFSDNALIKRSLKGIYDLLKPGGFLIYTNQPHHPQLELIARCLPNRDGKLWVMRLRSQQEMDQLVIEGGFIKEKTLVDKWGIFTVSIAVKV